MKREQRLDYHIADNAGTPHVSITDADSGDPLFQSIFSVERCELAEKISKRFNSHASLIAALRTAQSFAKRQVIGSERRKLLDEIDAALQLAEAETVDHDCIDIDNRPTGKECEACRREAGAVAGDGQHCNRTECEECGHGLRDGDETHYPECSQVADEAVSDGDNNDREVVTLKLEQETDVRQRFAAMKVAREA